MIVLLGVEFASRFSNSFFFLMIWFDLLCVRVFLLCFVPMFANLEGSTGLVFCYRCVELHVRAKGIIFLLISMQNNCDN